MGERDGEMAQFRASYVLSLSSPPLPSPPLLISRDIFRGLRLIKSPGSR